MEVRTGRQEPTIRSRYIVHKTIYSDIFYDLCSGKDYEIDHDVFILRIHRDLVTPQFVDFCVEHLTEYLYLKIPGLFELLDYEFDGEDFFIVYKAGDSQLITLDLYLTQAKNEPDYSKKIYHILYQIVEVLYALEKKQLVFGQISLNNIFVTKSGQIILGVAKISLVCLQYYMSKIDIYDDSIFLAPEFIKYHKLSTSTDIYSLGILAYYIYTQSWPYKNEQSIMKLKLLFNSGPQEPKLSNEKISDKLNYFILKSIQLNHKERWISFRLILNILEGKDVVTYERLSNRFLEEDIFEKDIVQYKKNKVGNILNWVFGMGIFCVVIMLIYFIFSAYFFKYEIVEIPNLKSVDATEVISTLTELRLDPVIEQYNYHPTIPENTVIRLEPSAGRTIKQGRRIKLFVSKGKQEILVPSFIGKTLDEIYLLFDQSNLNIQELESEYSFKYEKGLVISQIPKPDQYIYENGVVQVVISKGIPINFDSVVVVDDDYIRVSLTFDIVEKGDMQHIQIVETFDGKQNTLYSDYHYYGDSIIKDFIINRESELLLYKDTELLFEKQFLNDET